MGTNDRIDEYARVLLANIRLLNGGLALVAPGFLARRIGVDPVANPGITYVFRMFGIRTVLIGVDLLSTQPERRARALEQAPLIHASDTIAAVLASFRRGFPASGRAIILISAFNTLLAVLANRR
jgi:hypothetical protein